MVWTKSAIFAVIKWLGPFEIRPYKDHLEQTFTNGGSLSGFQMVKSRMESDHLNCWPFVIQTTSDILKSRLVRYNGNLNTELVWYFNVQKEVGCQMVWFLNAIWIPGSPTIWIPDKWKPSCFLMYWLGIQMVPLVHRTSPIDRPFEYRTIWNLNFKKVGIQILTVFELPQYNATAFWYC